MVTFFFTLVVFSVDRRKFNDNKSKKSNRQHNRIKTVDTGVSTNLLFIRKALMTIVK